MRLCVIFLNFWLLNLAYGSKIVGLFPYPSKSHSILGQSLMKELVMRGHEVSFVSMFPLKLKMKNYHDVVLTSNEIRETFQVGVDMAFDGINGIFQLVDWFKSCARMQELFMSDPAVQLLIKSNEKFDLCIIEMLCNECLLGFSSQFKCKVIIVSTIGQVKYINDMMHNPMPLSHTPHPFSSLSDRMNFWERMKNVFWTQFEDLLIETRHYPLQEAIYEKFFTIEKPSFREALKHSVSLTLLNTHFSLNFPQAYQPNMVSCILR